MSVKVSELPAASSANDTDEMVGNQSGTTYTVTRAQMHDILSTGSITVRSLADRFAEVFNIKDYGAVGDNTADDTAAIQAANDAAFTAKTAISLPAGEYKTTSTLDITVPIIGVGAGLENNERYGSVFMPTMTDGSACIQVDGKERLHFVDFGIEGIGPASANSCVGIKGINTSNRAIFTRLSIIFCDIGIQWDGWIIDFVTCTISHCGVGMSLTQSNGSSIIGGSIEANETGGVIVANSDGFAIYGTVIEGVTSGPYVKIDDCSSFTFSSVYMEGDDATFVHVGEDGNSINNNQAITFVGGHYRNASSKIILEFCNQVSFHGVDLNCKIEVGSYTQHLDLPVAAFTRDGVNHVPLSGRLSLDKLAFRDWAAPRPQKSLILNPYFEGGLRGFPTASFTRVTGAEETTETNFRPFKSAYKLTVSDDASAVQHATVGFDDAVADYLHDAGTTGWSWLLYLGVWVYVPSGQTWVEDAAGPAISIWSSIDVDASPDLARTFDNDIVLDRWNWVTNFHAIPNDGTTYDNFEINFGCRSTAGSIPSIGDTLTFTGLAAAFGQAADPQTLSQGPYLPDEHVGMHLPNSKISIFGDAAPTDSDTNWLVGDQVIDKTPTAGGTIGWVCTTAGSPGTWKTFGSIAS